MIFAPLFLAFPLPAAAVSVILGIILTGTGLDLAERSGRPGGSSGSVALHRALDGALAVVTAGAALALALAGPQHILPVAFLAGVVVILTGQGVWTRFSAPR